MDLNFIVYPQNESTYTQAQYQNHLVYVEKNIDGRNHIKIPCMYFPSEFTPGVPEKILLYFHGNSEDLGNDVPLFQQLKMQLKMSVLAVEYPGYGIYKEQDNDCSTEKIKQDANLVIQYAINRLRVKEQNIVIFGRSQGCGPACYLAERYKNINALILQSAYTSIQHLAKDNMTFGGSFLSRIISSHFDNSETIKKIESPILFIHGREDNMIPCSHSEILYKKATNLLCKLSIHQKMSHDGLSNEDIEHFIILPIRDFMQSIEEAKIVTELSLKNLDETIQGDWNKENQINQDEPEIIRIEFSSNDQSKSSIEDQLQFSLSRRQSDKSSTQESNKSMSIERLLEKQMSDRQYQMHLTQIRKQSIVKTRKINNIKKDLKQTKPIYEESKSLDDRTAIVYFKNYVINGKYGQIQEEQMMFNLDENHFE